MRLPALPTKLEGSTELPLWPPLLATRGPGSMSTLHAHHAMHFVFALDEQLLVRSGTAPWQPASGVLTAPDTSHAIDARGTTVLLVFLDPESAVGSTLAAMLDGPLRVLSSDECRMLTRDAEPATIMKERGVEWTHEVVRVLGGVPVASRRIHPRVRKLLSLLREGTVDGETSLDALADAVGLSPGRLMHVFTESIGIPLRPYLAWLKLQRAAAAIAAGEPLALAASQAGFADGPHMSRTFRRMFGVSPSVLQTSIAAS